MFKPRCVQFVHAEDWNPEVDGKPCEGMLKLGVPPGIMTFGIALEKIAARTGVPATELVALNSIRNKNLIAVGQTLRLPEPAAPAAQIEAAPVAEPEVVSPAASPGGR